MEPLKRIIELVKESNFKDANEICFDALYSKIEEKLTEKTETVRESCNCNNGNEELDPVNKKALKGKHKDRKDKDIDNDGDVDSSDKYLHKRRKAITKAVTEDDEKDFKPHMMYDPKTGKGYKAKTYQDHLRMDKMGYVHDKPEIKKESVELDEAPKMQKKDAPFTVVALKGKKVLDSIRDVGEKEVNDAVKMMKMSHKGAKISVEAKGGKVVHTESAPPVINPKHLELDNRLNDLIKKLVI